VKVGQAGQQVTLRTTFDTPQRFTYWFELVQWIPLDDDAWP
jgi:hypothetical protein